MSKIKKEIPKRAELTNEVEKVDCDNCSEEFLFLLKQGEHKFTIGLLDILKCLSFAEDQGAVPELPSDWWIYVKRYYQEDLQ